MGSRYVDVREEIRTFSSRGAWHSLPLALAFNCLSLLLTHPIHLLSLLLLDGW